MEVDRCKQCGAAVQGGLDGCRVAWDELSFKAYSNPAYAALHDLAFDAYCMQHPEQYGRSAKSYAAHLARLCCGLEYGGDPSVYRAIRKWLDGKVALEKPPLLNDRGSLTVMDILAEVGPGEHKRLVQEWARNVWEAYAEQHDLAREWVRTALGFSKI